MNTDSLTASQRRVFDQLILGKTNLEIAKAVFLAEKSVKGHVTAILKAFNCDSRSRLIARHYRGQA
jgi:DNA-binding NarL/FixJ family response regulator